MCEMRAPTPSKSPSVRVCGPRSCTSVAGRPVPAGGWPGAQRTGRGGGGVWQVRAVEHLGRGLARGWRLRNVPSPPLRGALAGQFTFQLCWNLRPVEGEAHCRGMCSLKGLRPPPTASPTGPWPWGRPKPGLRSSASNSEGQRRALGTSLQAQTHQGQRRPNPTPERGSGCPLGPRVGSPSDLRLVWTLGWLWTAGKLLNLSVLPRPRVCDGAENSPRPGRKDRGTRGCPRGAQHSA
ncbi:hypothetical protein HJG60_010054 [Phyllostomus discolor]|uniref:Uncharacterized protein n=1 Tax=Phyllostomus discolor TaxID=89673 RepID=A0A834AS68_9CHIR|nr:hypothetical protein HJG60_010054 [Phyllostomus discolor]